jgi:hypothetical protein
MRAIGVIAQNTDGAALDVEDVCKHDGLQSDESSEQKPESSAEGA